MRTALSAIVGISLLVCACASAPRGGVVEIDDRFDGPTLHREWDLTFKHPGTVLSNATGWTHAYESGELVVSGIEPASAAPTWAYATLTRSFGGPVSDFSLSLPMRWESGAETDS